MSKKKTFFVMILALVFVFVSAAAAFAAPTPAQKKRAAALRKSPVVQYLFLKRAQERLGLTDEQLAKIKDINFGLQEKINKVNYENANLRLKSYELKGASAIDYVALEKNLKARSDNRAMIAVERMKARAAVDAVLTSQQKDMLKKYRQAMIRRARAGQAQAGPAGQGGPPAWRPQAPMTQR